MEFSIADDKRIIYSTVLLVLLVIRDLIFILDDFDIDFAFLL